MSGRGLGHTGGTLDKLESIPGFRVELTTDELIAQVRTRAGDRRADGRPRAGRQEAVRAPRRHRDGRHRAADRVVDHVQEARRGADAIVLDVKVGDGAFMKTLEDARSLAENMLDLGRRAGREVVCLLTDMDQPLGARGGQRTRDPRGATTPCAAMARPTSPSSYSTPARGCWPLRPRHRRRRRRRACRGRRRGWVRARGVRALDPHAGWRPRSGALPARPSCTPCRRRGRRRDRVGALASVSLRSSSAPARTKADAIDHAVGVVCFAKRGDRSRR